MAKLWRRPNSTEPKDPPFVEVDLPHLRIEKPSLIFLNGFFAFDHIPEFQRSGLAKMEEYLAARPAGSPAADVYTYSHAGLKDVFNVAAYSVLPAFRACKAARNLAAGVIMPLVAKDFKRDEKGNVSGTPLPFDEAKKNLRNITFLGYSAGCVTAQECFVASLRMMKKIGYTEKDARKALNEVVYVGVGVVSRPGREKNRFTSLFLEATNDSLVRFKNRIWAPLRVFLDHFFHRLKIKQLGEHAAIITAALPHKHWEFRIRDGKTVKEQVRNLLPNASAFIKTYHELPRYVTQDEELSPFAKMVNYSLTNAVGRDKLFAPMELLEPPKGTDEATAAAYREKISKAYVKPAKIA
jgi:hypothetical protein